MKATDIVRKIAEAHMKLPDDAGYMKKVEITELCVHWVRDNLKQNYKK